MDSSAPLQISQPRTGGSSPLEPRSRAFWFQTPESGRKNVVVARNAWPLTLRTENSWRARVPGATLRAICKRGRGRDGRGLRRERRGRRSPAGLPSRTAEEVAIAAPRRKRRRPARPRDSPRRGAGGRSRRPRLAIRRPPRPRGDGPRTGRRRPRPGVPPAPVRKGGRGRREDKDARRARCRPQAAPSPGTESYISWILNLPRAFDLSGEWMHLLKEDLLWTFPQLVRVVSTKALQKQASYLPQPAEACAGTLKY